MNRSFSKIFLLPVVVIFSCSHQPVAFEAFEIGQPVWCWCGDNGRTGFNASDVKPPFQPAWSFSATSALGKALTASGPYLFFGTQDGMIYILDVYTGKTVRSFDIQKNIGVTCALDGNRLIVVRRKDKPSLTAVDFYKRDTIWEADIGPVPGELLVCDQKVVAVNEQGEVVALNKNNGNPVWKRKLNVPVYSTPALDGKSIVVSGDNGLLVAVSVVTGTIIWKQTLPEPVVSNPVIQKDKVYIGSRSGTFYCLSGIDGSILWNFKCRGGVYQAASVSTGCVVFGTSGGMVYCLDDSNGDEQWNLQTESAIGTSPLITENWIYFGTLDKMLYAVQKKSGKVGWSYETKGRVKTSPIIWKQMLIAASEDRFVYGFKPIK